MFRHSPSRGHRSKGFKVKDVLQICLLLAVCFWLIYQVKHSHEKKKEFDATDAKVSSKIFANSQSEIETVVNLGRKDIKPLVEERSIRDEKREEEEVEETEAEEEIKHEEEEPEDKDEEKDDERREGGDNEIDELDQEKTEEEALREEESGEEEKEKDDEGDDENEDQMENESVTEEDPEHDSSSINTHNHEAREEHYKGDDASSAVAHDGQNVSKGTESLIFENENGNVEAAEESNTNKENDVDENNLKFKEGKGEMAGNGTPRIGTTTEEKVVETGLPKPGDSSLQNSIVSTESSVQPEVISSTDAKMETIGSPPHNNFKQNQDRTVDGGVTTTGEDSGFRVVIRERNSNQSGTSIENQPNSNSVSLTGNESEDLKSLTAEKIGSSDSQGGDGSGSFKNIAQTGTSDTANQTVENTDPMLNKKAEITNEEGENDKAVGFSSANDDGDAVQHDPIDSSDTLLARHREKNAQEDSGSLLKTKEEERGRIEDAATE